MNDILAYAKDDDIRRDLQALFGERRDCELQLVSTSEALVGRLEAASFDALIADRSLLELEDVVDDHLQDAAGRPRVVIVANGTVQLPEAWGRVDDVDALEGWLDENLRHLPRPGAFGHRGESSAYFVTDTQDRSFEGADDANDTASATGLSHHTSEVERAQKTPARLLYVGPADTFRRDLEERSRQSGVAAAFADTADQVVLSNAADALDLAVFSIDEDRLAATRRAIRFLRRQQLGISFHVVLLARDNQRFGETLARSIGADALWRGPIDADDLLERVEPVTGRGDDVDVLVISAKTARRRLIESALSREPVNLFFADTHEQAIESIGNWQPDIVLLDEIGGEEGRKLTRRLRGLSPFALTRYIKVIGEEEAADHQGLDDLLYEPFERADIRRVIRRQAAQLAYGRLRHERDQLTGANTALVLCEHLERTLQRARRDDESVVVSAVDVDQLDTINERFGPEVGDVILRSLADSLRIVVDRPERIFRTSQDEFFVLQQTDQGEWATCRDRLDRALRVFETQTHRAADGRGAFATASAGAVVVPPVQVSAELCLQKSLLVLDRATRTNHDGVLLAHLDPEALPESATRRDRANERE